MAEQSVSGNGQAMQRVAEITINQAIVKYVVPAICGAAMVFAGIIGGRVLTGQDDIAKVLASVQIDVAVMKTDIGYLKEKVRP